MWLDGAWGIRKNKEASLGKHEQVTSPSLPIAEPYPRLRCLQPVALGNQYLSIHYSSKIWTY